MTEEEMDELCIMALTMLVEAGSKGITRLDFPEHIGMTDEKLELVMSSIESKSRQIFGVNIQ